MWPFPQHIRRCRGPSRHEAVAPAMLPGCEHGRIGSAYEWGGQVLELIVVSGRYRLIASTCNALDLGVENWTRPWPDPS